MISVRGVLRHWGARDYLQVVRAVVLLLRIERGLRHGTLPALTDRLGVPLVSSATAPAVEEFTDRLRGPERRAVRAVRRVLRHWRWGDTCLRRALATGYVLRHRSPALRIGVAKRDGVVTAHAWLEIDGRTLDPEGPATYLSLVAPSREET